MVINLNKVSITSKLDVRNYLIIKIKKLVSFYKDVLDTSKIYLETPASGIIFIDIFPHFTDKKWVNYENLSNKELMNIFRVLYSGNVYGFIENKIRIKPKIYN